MNDIILTKDIRCNKPDERILNFIKQFNHDAGPAANMFSNGYCYHFASMLASIFEGQVMWALGHSHMVFMSENLVPYDRYGVNDSECEAFISLDLMENESLYGFMIKDDHPHDYMADLITLAHINNKHPKLGNEWIMPIANHIPGYIEQIKTRMHINEITPEIILDYIESFTGNQKF